LWPPTCKQQKSALLMGGHKGGPYIFNNIIIYA